MSNETTPTMETATIKDTMGAKLGAALAKAQGEFTVPTKSKTAKMEKEGRLLYSYKYADLDEIIKATRPALTANQIAVVQNILYRQGAVGATTTLVHSSGERWTSEPVWIPSNASRPQDIGIAITYARRYSRGAALDIAAEEDTDAKDLEGHGDRKVRLPDEKKEGASGPASSQKDGKPYKGEAPPKGEKAAPAQSQDSGAVEYVNKQKVKRMFGIMQVHNVSVEAMKAYLGNMTPPIHSTDHIPVSKFDSIIADIQNGKIPEVNS